MSSRIDRLIINSPFEEPREHWHYEREKGRFFREKGRRPAGYVIASERSKAYDDPGVFVEIPLVNKIRLRVKEWREDGYPGVTGITGRLLEHWYDRDEKEYKRFFFCQLEAIETLIWLIEAPEDNKTGIDVPSDGGDFRRLCSKMATGSGKTVVMAMLIAWQTLNKVTYPQDSRFAGNFLIVAPGLTVKERLKVLQPSEPTNYYDEFNVVPSSLFEKLHKARILITNWHKLDWESEERIEKKRSVDKRGVMSDEAYVRSVLGEMSRAGNIIVLNDEAHHAWRIPAESKVKDYYKDEIEETKWVGGLDRIHRARNILCCFDFSATPFAPTGKKATEESLFPWIVSDFGLNDAIESGLVKTPRVVVRDDGLFGKDYRSRLYHIYNDPDVKDDLNRRAKPEEPLPDLVNNAYTLLGGDWQTTYESWKKAGRPTPPVMITVGNRVETAARIKYAFDHNKFRIPELSDPDKVLHIDSKVLGKAEAVEEAPDLDYSDDGDEEKSLTKKELGELLRRQVDTVGKPGEPGEQIRSVISVGMLSEGWDAKTVTHIMGLRAFSSQLLCEQVVGRGLRRTTYDIEDETGMYKAEYVNIFGVPFTFLPHESTDGPPPPPDPPKTEIKPDPEKRQYEISWPNIIRIDHVYRPELELDMKKVKVLELNAYETPTLAEIAPTLEGKPDVTRIESIDLEKLAREYRMQKAIFEAAAEVYDQMKPDWSANKEVLLAQLIKLVEKVMLSDRIVINPPLFCQTDEKKRLMLALNMTRVVQHIWEALRFQNTEGLEVVFDKDRPIRTTSDMRTWWTSKPCEYTRRSHINHCVFDSTWEKSEAFELDRNENVAAWVKNDHIGFEILYVFKGVVKKYYPDFIVKLKNGKRLVLETKGQDTQQDKTKREFLDEWVRAVNERGDFGEWCWAVSKNPADLGGIIAEIR